MMKSCLLFPGADDFPGKSSSGKHTTWVPSQGPISVDSSRKSARRVSEHA